MHRCPSPVRFVSWPDFTRGQSRSGGRVHAAPVGKVRQAPRETLVGAGQGRPRTSLGLVYERLAEHRGQPSAAIGAGRPILVVAHHLWRTPDTVSADPGADYVDQRRRAIVVLRPTRWLDALGRQVTAERPVVRPTNSSEEARR
jgi:hypothetical protein